LLGSKELLKEYEILFHSDGTASTLFKSKDIETFSYLSLLSPKIKSPPVLTKTLNLILLMWNFIKIGPQPSGYCSS